MIPALERMLQRCQNRSRPCPLSLALKLPIRDAVRVEQIADLLDQTPNLINRFKAVFAKKAEDEGEEEA